MKGADIVKQKPVHQRCTGFVIHEIIFSAPAQSRRHLPQRRRNSWPAGRTSAGSWTKHRGGSCCTPAGRPSPPSPCPPRWAGRWRQEGQRREELHLPEGQSGIQPHDPQPHPGQAEQEGLDQMHAQNGGTAGPVCQQMAALGAPGCRLLEPASGASGPALGPAARVGQEMQQPPGQTAYPTPAGGAEGDKPHDTPATKHKPRADTAARRPSGPPSRDGPPKAARWRKAGRLSCGRHIAGVISPTPGPTSSPRRWRYHV